MLPSLARPAKSIKDIEEQYGVNWLKWRPTALLEAAWKGDNESVASLVQFYKVSGDGHVINHQDGNGNTALIFASSAGQLKTVKFLIAAGVDVNRQTHLGKTALDCALYCSGPQFRKCVEVLREAGAHTGQELSKMTHFL